MNFTVFFSGCSRCFVFNIVKRYSWKDFLIFRDLLFLGISTAKACQNARPWHHRLQTCRLMQDSNSRWCLWRHTHIAGAGEEHHASRLVKRGTRGKGRKGVFGKQRIELQPSQVAD